MARKRKRSRLRGSQTAEEADRIENENRDRPRVALDAEHRDFIKRLWQDRLSRVLAAGPRLFRCAHLGHRQGFPGNEDEGCVPNDFPRRDPSKPNCWMYPLPCGSWRIFRFGETVSINEAPTWEDSPGGWKTCTINLTPSFHQIEKAFGAAECRAPRQMPLYSRTSPGAKAAVAAYGGTLELPEWGEKLTHLRPITLKLRKGRGLLAEFKFREDDEEDGCDVAAIKAGWTKARGPVWAKVIDVDTVARQTPYESLADNAVRQVSRNGEQCGLYVRTNDGKWDKQNADRIKDNLTHRGIDGGLQRDLLGWISDNPFYLVAKPFAGEWSVASPGCSQSGGRRWSSRRDGPSWGLRSSRSGSRRPRPPSDSSPARTTSTLPRGSRPRAGRRASARSR